MIHLQEYLRSINPQQFQECFSAWIKSVAQITDGEIIAIDGKKLKHSYDKQVCHGAINMVSAWATSNRLVLSQTKVNNKSFRYYSNSRANKSIRYCWLYCNN